MTRKASFLLLAIATLVTALVASYQVNDTDFWQHLTIGREIWRTHRIPLTHQWTWANPPLPDINYAWGFQALLWPFWAAAGATGMIVWKWWTALVPFALGLATARRLGASCVTAAPVAVLAAIAARDRMEPRPETLAAIFLGLFVWILEVRRHDGPDRTWLLPVVSLAWANAHNTWFLGLAVLGVHALVGSLSRQRGAGRLWLVLVACVAVSFVNPWGWRTLWQPFAFALQGRDQIMFRAIVELQPTWSTMRWQELEPVALLAWPLVAIVRFARGRRDPVELLLLVLFAALAWTARRFIGAYAIVMTPYVARGLGEWFNHSREAAPSMRAALASAALCVALAIPTLVRPEAPLGFAINPHVEWPGLASYLEREAPAKRLFNHFELGGYLLWRQYPGHKPFIDTHQTVPRRELLDTYFYASVNEASWRKLDDEFQFDAVALDRYIFCDSMVAFLDRDSRWARVHQDEGSILYLKRGQGFDAAIARDSPGRH